MVSLSFSLEVLEVLFVFNVNSFKAFLFHLALSISFLHWNIFEYYFEIRELDS